MRSLVLAEEKERALPVPSGVGRMDRAEVEAVGWGRNDGTRIAVRDRRFLAMLGSEKSSMAEEVRERR